MTGDPRVTYAYDVLSPEERERLGLTVPPPKLPTDEAIAAAFQIPADEYALMRGIRNAADYAEREERIRALRQAKREAAVREARDQPSGGD